MYDFDFYIYLTFYIINQNKLTDLLSKWRLYNLVKLLNRNDMFQIIKSHGFLTQNKGDVPLHFDQFNATVFGTMTLKFATLGCIKLLV